MALSKKQQAALFAYADIFGAISPDKLSPLREMLSADVRFTDPFNQLAGPDAFIHVFEHMFEVMTNPHFEILDIAQSAQAGYIKWRMTGDIALKKPIAIDLTGMSEIHFDENGLVHAHIDHWDSASQLLAHLPLIGGLFRPVMRRFSLPQK